MKNNEEWNCEYCFFYGVPGGAFEGAEPDCMFESTEDDNYPPCSIEAEYVNKMQRIISNRFEAAGDDAKLEADLRLWLQCELQCSGDLDLAGYAILKNEIHDLISKARSMA